QAEGGGAVVGGVPHVELEAPAAQSVGLVGLEHRVHVDLALGQHPGVEADVDQLDVRLVQPEDRKSTRLNSSHVKISYADFCSNKKNSTLWCFSLINYVSYNFSYCSSFWVD